MFPTYVHRWVFPYIIITSIISAFIFMVIGILGSNSDFLTASASLGGVSAALSALFIYIKTSEQKYSSDHVELVEKSFIEAINIIDLGQNRGNYLNAARILKNTREIIDRNLKTEYAPVYLALLLRYSLTIREKVGIDRKNNNPSRYLGGRTGDMFRAYAELSAEGNRYGGLGFTSMELGGLPIHEGSLYEIYLSTKFPSESSLIRIENKFSESILKEAVHDFPALLDYIKFLRRHNAVDGIVYRIEDDKTLTEVYSLSDENKRCS